MKTPSSHNVNHSGFRIHYFRDLANPGTLDLRTILLDQHVPFDTHRKCPACQIDLSVLCTYISRQDNKHMRLGCCASCGYVGYMDRPTRAWMLKYYREDWDNAKLKDPKREAVEFQHGLTKQQKLTIRMADRPEVAKDRPVCDIGCGDGLVMKEFTQTGFHHVIGVENSRFRAELTQAKFGFPVIVGNFESKEVVDELKRYAPIGVFYTFHVMEHVYEPREVIRAAAQLQGAGDYFILAMPNGIGEPKITTLFWLPHLHAYTNVALEKILNAFNYEVVDDNTESAKHLIMVCRKVTDMPVKRYQPRNDYLDFYAKAVRSYFYLDQMKPNQRYCFSWTSKVYHTNLKPTFSSKRVDSMVQRYEQGYWYVVSRLFKRFANKRSMVISALDNRLISWQTSPLEIQYDGSIEMLLR